MMRKTLTSVVAGGRVVEVIDSKNFDGNIIDASFFRYDYDTDSMKYTGSISNFNNQFVGNDDLEEAIVKFIETKYMDTKLVKISRFVD